LLGLIAAIVAGLLGTLMLLLLLLLMPAQRQQRRWAFAPTGRLSRWWRWPLTRLGPGLGRGADRRNRWSPLWRLICRPAPLAAMNLVDSDEVRVTETR